jgi:hypothetical protein
MRCWRCGERNPSGVATCLECQAVLAPTSHLSSVRQRRATGPVPQRTSQPVRALLISLFLALPIGLAGYGAVRAADILQHSMSVTGPIDVVTAACSAYKSQNYALLTQKIDPAPVPPALTDAFNPNVVQTQLKALDKIQGTVDSCQPGQSATAGDELQYSISVQRTHHPLPITVVLVLRRAQDGAWKISRETNFAGSAS